MPIMRRYTRQEQLVYQSLRVEHLREYLTTYVVEYFPKPEGRVYQGLRRAKLPYREAPV